MSRKARSKKGGGDANVPNFVFNPNNVDFNFSGSNAPNSPTSTTSSQQPFTFGSPTMNPAGGSTSTGAFTFRSPSSTGSNPMFGSGPPSGGMSSEFTFSTPSSPLKRNVSDLALPGPSLVDPLKRTASDVSPTFTFGSQTTPATPGGTSPAGGFTFRSPVPTAAGQMSPSTPGGFSFGATPGGSISSTDTTKKPAFTFGGTATTGTITSSTAASDSSPKPAFTFGSPTINASPAPAPGFNFGSPAASSPAASIDTTPKAGFSFGTPAAGNAVTTQIPASLAPSSSTAPTHTVPGKISSSTYSFGSPTSTSAATITPTMTTAPAPSFGAAPNTKDAKESPITSTVSVDSTAKTTTGTPLSPFGSPKPASTTAPPSPAPTIPSFSFGKSSDTSSSPTSAASTPKFSFNAPEKKDSVAATATSSIPTTSISAPAASKTFSLATPAAPAAAPKPNVFSFTKVLEDLERIASQPPSQIQASLLTPALQNLQQNQVVTMTNFRIDNILPTTRFSELPEQAQMELDQLNQYIRAETQKCDFISKHGARQHVDTIENTRTQTDSLTQQLGALSSSLTRQMQNIEHLFDKAGAQLRHAADASSVIEACKHHGTASRWLSGYSTDDDYFANLSTQLQARLEEYKHTVWEIERMTESWSKHKMRTPQDIGRIMKEQNSALLALANRVVLLDENVKREKERYAHYAKMYS